MKQRLVHNENYVQRRGSHKPHDNSRIKISYKSWFLVSFSEKYAE